MDRRALWKGASGCGNCAVEVTPSTCAFMSENERFPDESWEERRRFPRSYHRARCALHRAGLQSGEKCLIHAVGAEWDCAIQSPEWREPG